MFDTLFGVAEITHRFQTARPEVRQLLLQYLLPWLHNMELVDPNVPPGNPLSYFQVIYDQLLTTLWILTRAKVTRRDVQDDV